MSVQLTSLTYPQPVAVALALLEQATLSHVQFNGADVIFGVDKEVLTSLSEIITDSGLVYVTTIEEVKELWDRIVEENTIVDWLNHAVSRWFLISFERRTADYDAWISTLIHAACIHTNYAIKNATMCARSTDDLGNLFVQSELKDILEANPWFVFLLTLSFAETDIINIGFKYAMALETAPSIVRPKTSTGDEGEAT
jgi:hypothetical protein